MNPPEISKEMLSFVASHYNYRHKYWSAYFWPTREKANLKIPKYYLKEILFDCFDKINACYYHMKRLKEEEEKIIYDNQISKIHTSIYPGVIGVPSEAIVFEYEAFILQQEACLQVIARVISLFFGSHNNSFKKLHNILSNVPKAKSRKAQSILSLLKKFNNYFKEIGIFESGTRSIRDFASHYGQLKVGTINIQISMSEIESFPAIKAKKIDHLAKEDPVGFTNKEDLYDFCKRNFYYLCQFIGLVTGKLFSFRPVFGNKTDKNGKLD
ncbi:MAG: hypothetical protein M1429_03460 [Patescibacteria group bacterium]|nr:hypothetical protein [Patescibacteria group bacterium]